MSVARKTRPLGHVKLGSIVTDNDPLNKQSTSLTPDNYSNNNMEKYDSSSYSRRSFDVGSLKTTQLRKASLNVGITLPDDICRVSKDSDAGLKSGLYFNLVNHNNDKHVLKSVTEGITQEFNQSANGHSSSESKSSRENDDRKIPSTKPLPSIKSNKDVKETKNVVNVTEEHKLLEESEKALRKQVTDLEGHIGSLKKNLSDRDAQITQLDTNIRSVTVELDKYKPLYESEVKDHKVSKHELEKLTNHLMNKEKELAALKEAQEMKLKKIVADYEAKIVDLESEKDKIIADLQEKIERLKKQIASNFDGKAWERQHQIEELTKEMKRMQEENETQKIQIRRADQKRQEGLKSIKAASGCTQCQKLGLLIGEFTATLSIKEDTIQKLTVKCNEFNEMLKK